MIREPRRDALPGIPVFLALIAGLLGTIAWVVWAGSNDSIPGVFAGLGVAVVLLILMCGVFTVGPNQGLASQLFWDYKGTAREPGLRWANPLYTKKAISLMWQTCAV